MARRHWHVRLKGKNWEIESDFSQVYSYMTGISVYFASMQQEWLERFGKAAVAQIRRNIQKGGISGGPLHPVTVALKGSGQPLVDSGNMLKTVSWSISGNHVNIGWSDPKAAQAAAVADYGATVTVSEPIRRLFAKVGYPLRQDTTVLVIRPRPIAKDVQDQMHASGAWDKAFNDASAAAASKAGTVQYMGE